MSSARFEMQWQCEAKARAAVQMDVEGVTELYKELGMEVTPNLADMGLSWRSGELPARVRVLLGQG